jgi:acetyl-CoA carboxylase carboxyltransferase component
VPEDKKGSSVYEQYGKARRVTMTEALQPFLDKKIALENLDYSARHAKGLLSAAERIALLFDRGTFTEIAPLARESDLAATTKPGETPRDGIVVGYGKVNDRMVGAAAYDIQYRGGSMGKTCEWKFTRLKRLVQEQGFPLVILSEGTGARLEEEVSSQGAYDNPQFTNLVALSGYVPIVVAVMGVCVGGHANITAIGDFVPMTKNSSMMLAGPPLLRTKMGIETTLEELGGARKHVEQSGMADLLVADDKECIEKIKEFLGYLPDNCSQSPPIKRSRDKPDRRCEELLNIVPTDLRFAYDIKKVITSLIDDGRHFEMQPSFASNVVTTLARMDGRVVGIIANQPAVMSGTLDVKACRKICRFINFCDCFGIALIFLQDVPGYYPGPQSETDGIIRWSTRLLYEIGHTTVPRFTVMLRKAFGLAHYGMNSLGMEPDLLIAWPLASFSAISPDDAVQIMFGKQLAEAENSAALRQELVAEFEAKTTILPAAEAALVDDVIDPRDTRKALVKALAMAKNRRQGHTFKRRGITPI